MSLLAKLSAIKFSNFGLSCFNTLKDILCSSKEMKDAVTSVLESEVIELMIEAESPLHMPVTLILGLYELVASTKSQYILTRLFQERFTIWLRLYCDKLQKLARQGQVLGNHDHHDAILKLMCAGV